MPTIDNPIRLEILKRLSGILEEISVAGGYRHDLAGSVFRGRNVFGDETPLPSVSILESPIPLDQIPSARDNSAQAGPWELVLQGWVKDDRRNPTDPAHVLMADVKKRLTLERKKVNNPSYQPELGILGLGRNVTAMYVGTGVVRPPDEISAKAYFYLSVTLDIVETMDDPYSI